MNAALSQFLGRMDDESRLALQRFIWIPGSRLSWGFLVYSFFENVDRVSYCAPAKALQASIWLRIELALEPRLSLLA
jgi:hypothetical protein